ncbi:MULTISPECIES: hypothetical protein [unclassified Pseudovibrio]|uniref:hypothetical protein n=1 Tax=unclassified Pseudovibrio TaxID=2627060 RepID=UPI0007B2AC55|nr:MULTISPECIES: hypothetical protein [unclassified Pseudovibrio]KZK92584.1 hypothetical protein PsW74_05511 [Pseudovibrio sp. W74]KZL10372.1 hypothetical protein PsAD14_01279 [Pseudovibrio sp. Ad14]
MSKMIVECINLEQAIEIINHSKIVEKITRETIEIFHLRHPERGCISLTITPFDSSSITYLNEK